MTAKISEKTYNVVICTICGVTALLCLYPLVYTLLVSFCAPSDINASYFLPIPKKFTLQAYVQVMTAGRYIVKAIGVSVFRTLVGTVTSLAFCALLAYALSRKALPGRNAVIKLVLFCILFNGGLIPTYILITQYLHLGNTIFVYVFTGLFNFGNVLLLRASFQQVPKELMESSQIDGANQMTVFFKIMIPLSASMIAMIFCMNLLSRWNDFQTSLYYIDDSNLYTIQYLLQKTLQEVQVRNQTYAEVAGYAVEPSLTLQYAMSVIAALPVFVAFPFMQKYFSKGITVGSVKG